MAPEYLEKAVNILENKPQYGWVTPKTLVYGAGCHFTWNWVPENYHGIDKCISPCSALYRRKIWEELGGYLENMTDREDWEFWIRARELAPYIDGRRYPHGKSTGIASSRGVLK